MDRNASLIREVEAILQAPVFMRSPGLKRILEYLLEREKKGSGCPTQFDIAREALGKSTDFDETIDSSVRAQVSRLRKALSDYYLTHQPTDKLYVYIRVGEYRLRSARLSIAYPDIASSRNAKPEDNEPRDKQPVSIHENGLSQGSDQIDELPVESPKEVFGQRLQGSRKFLLVALCFGALLLAFGAFSTSSQSKRGAVTASVPIDVPYVSVDVRTYSNQDALIEASEIIERTQSQVRELLFKSMITRLADKGNSSAADYKLTITIQPLADHTYNASLVLTTNANRVLVERTLSQRMSETILNEELRDQIVSIISPTGFIANDVFAHLSDEPKSGFECFVYLEHQRAQGQRPDGMVDRCIELFQNDEFIPYVEVRRAFAIAQTNVAAGKQPDDSSLEWQIVARLLDEYPENPYVNTLAAKLLIAQGNCSQAATFARDAFSRGRTYPALELAVIVDAYGCEEVSQLRPYWNERIRRIASANPEPDELLKVYLALGALLSSQTELVEGWEEPFTTQGRKSHFEAFKRAVISASNNRATRDEIALIEKESSLYLFNRETRIRLVAIVQGNQPNAMRRPPTKELALRN